jgi:hypothetical protein
LREPDSTPQRIAAGGVEKWSAEGPGSVTYRTAPQRRAKDTVDFTVQWSISANGRLSVEMSGEGRHQSKATGNEIEGWVTIEVGPLRRRGLFGW